MEPASELIKNFASIIIMATIMIIGLVAVAYYLYNYSRQKHQIEIQVKVGNVTAEIKGDITYDKANGNCSRRSKY